jgi:hypothetical protein
MKKLTLPFALLALITFTSSCHKKIHQQPQHIVLQPDSKLGQDCLVAARESDGGLYASSNHNANPDVTALVWTYNADGAGVGVNRTYIKFVELSDIPSNARILSARLFLYGVESGVAAPIGNSFYPGSPYEAYVDNSCWLKRVTGSWSAGTITWDTKPGTTEEYKASIPASTSQWNYNAPMIDVTNMVRTMVQTGENNGFCLELKTEEIYRGIVFGSSEHPDPARRPKLVLDYIVSNR